MTSSNLKDPDGSKEEEEEDDDQCGREKSPRRNSSINWKIPSPLPTNVQCLW
jgi:hypothetical protein